MTVNANSLTSLSTALKYHYANEVKDLVRKESALLDMLEEDRGFKKTLGGRSLIWPMVVDRPNNSGVRTETDFLPGLSGGTNDDIDRVSVVEASLGRSYAYADVAFTEQQMADAHKDFEFFKGWGFARHVKTMQDDFRTQLEMMLLGDKTGVVGVISGTPTVNSGTTTITLKAASTIGVRGIYGTQRLYKNMKISFIRATDFNSDARLSKIHSNIGGGGSGTSIFKIASVTGVHDVSATPQITVAADLTSGGGHQLGDGDVIVLGDSRAVGTTGGTTGTEADLRCFDGLFSFIDDGTLTSTLYGLTRSSNTVLNSQTDLATSGRQLTWQRLQIMFDKLYRRRGSDDMNIEDEYMLLSERSVRTNYAGTEGEAGKRYIQEDKAKKLVSGFKDVTMAFLGNDTLLPWACVNMCPYGHALLMRKKDLKVMWDIPPGIMSADGLQLRQIAGKPVYYMALQGVGNFKKDEPWLDGRISGLTGAFSA